MLIALTLIFTKLGINFKLEPATIPVKLIRNTAERASIISRSL
jgi:hypothetical protein